MLYIFFSCELPLSQMFTIISTNQTEKSVHYKENHRMNKEMDLHLYSASPV